MKKYTVFFLLLFVCFFSSSAQGLLRRAEIAYNEKNYLYAAEAFQRYYDRKGDVNPSISINLANCYYQLNHLEEALALYEKVDRDLFGPQDCYNYANLEYMFGNYDSAIALFSLARGKAPSRDLEALINLGKNNAKWALANKDASNSPALVYGSDVEVNGQSLGLQYYYDGVVYAYGDTLGGSQNLDERGMPILNLSYVSTMSDAYISSPILFSQNLSSQHHVGAVDFGNNGRAIYYTKLDRVGANRKSRIYVSYLSEQTSDWTDGIMLPFCDGDDNYAHPALSKDGNTLYFASDTRRSLGGMDLFKVERNKRGAWGRPRNLGSKINTKGDELFPYVTPQDVLTFSSNGHRGFGGLDVFWARIENGVTIGVENAMKPINSSFDDFALVINPNDQLNAYVSSNREAKGKQDQIHSVDFKPRYYAQLFAGEMFDAGMFENEKLIHSSVLADFEASFIDGATEVDEQSSHLFGFDNENAPAAISPVFIRRKTGFSATKTFVYDPAVDTTNTIKAVIVSALSFEPIANTPYEVLDVKNKRILHKGVSDVNGQIYINKDDIDVEKNQELKLLANGGGGGFTSYRVLALRADFEVFDMSGIIHMMPQIDNEGESNYAPIVVSDKGLGAAPFEVNKVELTEVGKSYLDAWVEFLLENPNARVKMMLHTDQRGSVYYNFRLSQNRAFTCKSYLIKKGVNDKQIIGRGYGERYPLVNCDKCTEEDHARNRRVEIELIDAAK